MNHQQALADFSFAFKPSEAGVVAGAGSGVEQPQQTTVTTTPGLSTLSNTSSSSTCEETTPTTTTTTNSNMVPLEMEQQHQPPINMNEKMMQHNDNLQQQQQNNNNNHHQRRGPKKIAKAFGKKIGGAFQKINVVKWIDDLEQDQELADHLDRINADTADEQERAYIKQQAHDACLRAMKDHLLEFLSTQPQATYEEWICNLHPDNINTHLDGLTNIPLIDHRFYVTDSDHRILWNEHLNDLEDPTNMKPIRHYVAARSFMHANTMNPSSSNNSNTNNNSTTTTTTTTNDDDNNNNQNDSNNLISLLQDDDEPEEPQLPKQNCNNNNNPEQAAAAPATTVTAGVDLLSL